LPFKYAQHTRTPLHPAALASVPYWGCISSSSSSSKRSKQTNQTIQVALCYVKRGRENNARPCALARHQRPGAHAQRKTRGPPPPRRPNTATPPLRPVLDRKAGTEATHLRLHHGAEYFKAARRAATSRAECKSRRHRAVQSTGASPRASSSTGQGPATRRKQNSEQSSAQKRKQPVFANSK